MRSTLALTLLLAGCAATSSATPIAHAHAERMRPELALARVLERHPDGIVYAVDLTRSSTKEGLSAWLLEDDQVRGIHVDLLAGTFDEEVRAIHPDVRAPARELATEIRARGVPMSTGLAYMLDRYGVDRVSAVELEMHGVVLVLEAVVGAGETATTFVHDPDDGRYLMTEGT